MTTTSVDCLKQRKKYFIYDLPYPERRKLCQILDADGKWEELGGRFMGVKQIELCGFGRAIFHKGSPTGDLLDWFGRGNGTIDQLFVYLSHMNHQWAMTVILDYVSSKYHCLLNKSSMDTSSIEIPSRKLSSGKLTPTAPSQSQIRSNSSSELLGATGVNSAFIKPQVDSFNFNRSSSQPLLLPPKLSGVHKESRMNGHDLHRQRQQTSPVMNGTASKLTNESHPSCENGNVEFDGAHKQARPSPVDQHSPKSIGKADARPSLKLNIPISPQPSFSIATNGVVKKINKVPEKRTSLDNSSSSEDWAGAMKIPYKEILKITNNFGKENVLGQGGFGIVYKANWKGNVVAIKRISPKNKTDSRFAGQVSLKQLQTEMKVLSSFRIDNILALYGVSTDGAEPCLVYQYMINGSLEDRLLLKCESKALNWEQRAKIALGTAKGLNFLHSALDKPLIHGDIKSANILLDKDMEPKIGDFGLARIGPSDDLTHVKVSSVHGTQVYLPPEYLRSAKLSEKVDVYSYGIVLLEIATGLRAYNEKFSRHKYLVDLVKEDLGDCEPLRDKKAERDKYGWFHVMLQLGKKCSSLEKKSRPSMANVLEQFELIQKRIDTTIQLDRLTVEMERLSPRDIQMYYDLLQGLYSPQMPSGVQGPPPYLDHDISLPSVLPSIHTSEIREPPSQYLPPSKYEPCFLVPGSSTAATDGSNKDLSSTSPVPILTELGTNQPPGTSTLSGIPSRDQIVITPKREESSMNLFDDDDGDSGDNEDGNSEDDEDEEEEDDDNDSLVDNERHR